MSSRAALPAGIWALGFVSLLMDVSSEMIHSLLPVFMVASLGASATMVGLVEGIAEATALIVRIFSGTLSDYLGRRKPLVVLGYAMGAVCKPGFALATSVPWVFAARFLDRIGKGIRAAPRDALIADLTDPSQRGRAYGLRQALDTVGAFLGPLAGVALMWSFSGDFRMVFWVAAAPAAASVLLLWLGVQEPDRPAGELKKPIELAAIGSLGPLYWRTVALGGAFTLARLSEAFLVLRARQLGLPDGQVPLVMVLMNTVYAAAAYPAGFLADHADRRVLVAGGLVVLAGAHAALAWAGDLAWAAAGVALWGLHMALTQGLLSAMVADSASPELRGTAFGVYNFVSGLAMLAAGAGAGLLWDRFGAPTVFMAGAAVALAAAPLAARPGHHR